MSRHPTRRYGFSSMELIVVLLLLSSLAAMTFQGAIAIRDGSITQREALAFQQLLESAGVGAAEDGTYITCTSSFTKQKMGSAVLPTPPTTPHLTRTRTAQTPGGRRLMSTSPPAGSLMV
jgi:type II secretory pathway pseudopilin PulG